MGDRVPNIVVIRDGEQVYEGPERRARPGPIHPTRWRLLAIWILIFTLVVGYSLRVSRETAQKADTSAQQANDLAVLNAQLSKVLAGQIKELKINRAKVVSLEKTNCALVRFLLTARKARYNGYLRSHNPNDLQATQGYEQLVGPFLGSIGNCPIPPKLTIKDRPLEGTER